MKKLKGKVRDIIMRTISVRPKKISWVEITGAKK